VDYAEFPVVEWTTYFRNGGKTDTSIIENIEPLDTKVPVTDNGLPMVLYSKGCGGMDTYSLQKRPLNQLDSFSLSNEWGGKTVETIPFFNILMDQRGMIGAVGCPNWSVFRRPTDAAIAVEQA
jgi:hypothetical protein